MKVLVIDDEEIVRKALARALSINQHQVYMASGGVEGITLWENHQPDVVLLDVLMPEMSGPKVLEKMQGHNAKVFLMSAFKGEYDTTTAKELGADGFIPKPFENVFDLIEKIEKLYG